MTLEKAKKIIQENFGDKYTVEFSSIQTTTQKQEEGAVLPEDGDSEYWENPKGYDEVYT